MKHDPDSAPETGAGDWTYLHRHRKLATVALVACVAALIALRHAFPSFVISGWCVILLASAFELQGRLPTLLRAFLGTALIMVFLERPGLLPWSHHARMALPGLLPILLALLLPGALLSVLCPRLPVIESAMAGAIYSSLPLFHQYRLGLIDWLAYALPATVWLACLLSAGALLVRALSERPSFELRGQGGCRARLLCSALVCILAVALSAPVSQWGRSFVIHSSPFEITRVLH